jgi:hypothetical protein
MEDQDFLNELEQLTKTMSQEFSNPKSSMSVKETSKDSKLKDPDKDFHLAFEGTEGDYFKAIEKMLGSDMNFKLDESDPQAKEMMRLLSKNL